MSRANKPELTDTTPVRQTDLKTWLTYEMMSPLGRELIDLAAEIERTDAPEFDEADVERELKIRRGGYSQDDE